MSVTETTTITLASIGVLVSLMIAIYNWMNGIKIKSKDEGERQGTINTKLDTIITSIGKLSEELTKLQNGLHEIIHQVERLEERVTALEKKKLPKPKMDADE